MLIDDYTLSEIYYINICVPREVYYIMSSFDDVQVPVKTVIPETEMTRFSANEPNTSPST
jgi:hypothetical protein